MGLSNWFPNMARYMYAFMNIALLPYSYLDVDNLLNNFLAHSVFAFSTPRNSMPSREPFVSATKKICLTLPSVRTIAQSGT